MAGQVILSMQLGFAVVPLLGFTGERAKMGEFVNPLWIKILGWACATLIITLNVKLLLDAFLPAALLKAMYGFFVVSSAEEQADADAAQTHGWRLRLSILRGDESQKPSVPELMAVSEAVVLTKARCPLADRICLRSRAVHHSKAAAEKSATAGFRYRCRTCACSGRD